MLRVTVRENPGVLTFVLEGKVAEPWVREIETCRQHALSSYFSQYLQKGGSKAKKATDCTAVNRQPAIRFDLTGVTFIDAAGKAYLAAMGHLGADFISADCLTKAIVAEITHATAGNSPRSSSTKGRPP